MSSTTRRSIAALLPSLFRDIRVIRFIGQVVFAIVLIAVVSSIWTSILTSLQVKNLTPNIDFLGNRSGFDISERPSWYSSNSTYGDAFRVGVENSLRIISIGLVLTTILGIFGGVFLLSSNWLVRTITRGLVEILRNTPLLVQLIAWYFIVMLSLPLFQEAMTFPQEGILPLPIRALLYVVAVVVVWIITRLVLRAMSYRDFLWNALLAAIITLEAAFRWGANLYGQRRVDNPGVIIYFVVSIAIVVILWFALRTAARWQFLGLAIGQLFAGALFYFGLLPQTVLARIEVYPSILLSKRGLVLPEILPTSRFIGWALIAVLGISAAVALWIYLGRHTERTGNTTRRALIVPLLIFAVLVGGWILVGIEPSPATVPVLQKDGTTLTDMTKEDAVAAGLWTRANELAYTRAPLLYVPPVQKISPAGIVSGLVSGSVITPEYMALLLGLVVYTAAFIAEIVRAGILAVPHGQTEASHALGLTTSQTLGIIIMPQALRVIIPPLGNQYLNLSKNSSLAVSVAYADLVLVTQTIMNQSGQSVTGITLIMLTYLTISLIIAAGVNIVNRRFKIVTR